MDPGRHLQLPLLTLAAVIALGTAGYSRIEAGEWLATLPRLEAIAAGETHV